MIKTQPGYFIPNEGLDVSLTISDGNNTTTITKEDYISASVEFLMQTTTVTTCTGVFYDSGEPAAIIPTTMISP
ncbi:MAG: hypothetical protein R2764_07775 [Bacteroidales bacterium]